VSDGGSAAPRAMPMKAPQALILSSVAALNLPSPDGAADPPQACQSDAGNVDSPAD